MSTITIKDAMGNVVCSVESTNDITNISNISNESWNPDTQLADLQQSCESLEKYVVAAQVMSEEGFGENVKAVAGKIGAAIKKLFEKIRDFIRKIRQGIWSKIAISLLTKIGKSNNKLIDVVKENMKKYPELYEGKTLEDVMSDIFSEQDNLRKLFYNFKKTMEDELREKGYIDSKNPIKKIASNVLMKISEFYEPRLNDLAKLDENTIAKALIDISEKKYDQLLSGIDTVAEAAIKASNGEMSPEDATMFKKVGKSSNDAFRIIANYVKATFKVAKMFIRYNNMRNKDTVHA